MVRNGEEGCGESSGGCLHTGRLDMAARRVGIGVGLHELGYREDHNLTLEHGVNLLLPLPGVSECYPTFPVRMPDMRLAQVGPLPGMFPDCA
jgi:hypothetical protein